MSMHNVVVSINGTEQSFIAAFIKSVMAETAITSQHDLSVTINSEPVSDNTGVDTELAKVNWSGSVSLTFTFTIDSYAVLTFTRSGTASTAGYTVTGGFPGVVYSNSAALTFSAQSISSNSSGTRIWKYQVFSNANALYLVFGIHSETFPLGSTILDSGSYTTKMFQTFSYKNSSEWFGGFYIGANLHDKTGNLSVVKDRLEYNNDSTDPTDVEIIQSKVAVQKNGIDKTVTMTNIWDSSFNSAVNFPVSINNASYVYLNNYTLMPI